MFRNTVRVLLVLSLITAATWLSSTPAAASDTEQYTACNLWYEDPERMWSTGYQKGTLLPAGTSVTNVEIKKKWTKKYITFVDAETGVQHGILWIPKHRPGVSLDEMRLRLFSEKSFDELTEGFTAAEKDAVKKGQVVKGMSKDAVLVSFGYPPETGTVSLNTDRWKYWKDRFNTLDVKFAGTKVASVID